MAHKGDDNTPLGSMGQEVKTLKKALVLSDIKNMLQQNYHNKE